jgi:hypothetical protein
MKFYLLLSIVFGSFISFATTPVKPVIGYIEQFKSIAISEMNRTGIPASIKLAQGIMESMSGRSELAVNANNHFGIKCKPGWDGETYQYKDDDLDESGELIHSCFRKYTAAENSYIDHSEFLTRRKRYKVLFDYDKSDYISWAKGLQACGYATDPNYATKLIEAIEKYNLYIYDQVDSNDLVASNVAIAEIKSIVPEKPMEIVVKSEQTSRCVKLVSSKKYKKHLKRRKSNSKNFGFKAG